MVWTNRPGRAVPYRLQQACFRRDNHTCQHCGYQGTPNAGTLHADHKHNRATGGPNTLDNLETLCTTCHTAKTRRESAAGIKTRQARLRIPPEHHPGLI